MRENKKRGVISPIAVLDNQPVENWAQSCEFYNILVANDLIRFLSGIRTGFGEKQEAFTEG
jgi:hypothetical protein